MAKHNIGDIVSYKNKNTKTDIVGEIIAVMTDWGSVDALVEIHGGESRGHVSNFVVYEHNLYYKFNEARFNRVAPGSLAHRSQKRSLWVPMMSKNLLSAFPPKDYDPSQNGDKDEDI